MRRDKIFEKLREIIFIVLEPDIPKEKIIPVAKLVGDLGADSLDIIQLFLDIEEDFAILIPDENSETLITITVADIVDYIYSHQERRKTQRVKYISSLPLSAG